MKLTVKLVNGIPMATIEDQPKCEGGHPVETDGGPCDVAECQACCPHTEHDHYICLDCGYEGEPSDWYNEDEGSDR